MFFKNSFQSPDLSFFAFLLLQKESRYEAFHRGDLMGKCNVKETKDQNMSLTFHWLIAFAQMQNRIYLSKYAKNVYLE